MDTMKPLKETLTKCKDEPELPGKVDCLIDVVGKGIDVVSARFDGVDKQLEINWNLILGLTGRVENLEKEMRDGFAMLPTFEQFKEQGDRVQADIKDIRLEMAKTRGDIKKHEDKMDFHIDAMEKHSKKMDSFNDKIDEVLDAVRKR